MSPRRIPGPDELIGRGRQWADATADRLRLLPWGAPGASRAAPSLPFPARSPTAASGIDQRAIMARADLVLSGRYPLLGVRDGIEWGVRPDWSRDALANRSASNEHFTRVKYLNPELVGDHKVTWELNRHHWVVWLAQAAALRNTGDPDKSHSAAMVSQSSTYDDAISAHVERWLTDNPRGVGINWASSLEVAFRAIAWTWVWHLRPESLPAALQGKLATSLYHHGRHVERWLSTWFSPNTHLTGEALALFYLGVAFPAWPRSSVWREMGWRILREQALVQLRPDGTYFEQTGWYQAYTVDFYLHALALAAHAGLTVPREVTARVHAGARALHAMTRRDGTVVRWGDDDGGRLLPLSTGAYGDVRDTLAHAAVHFRDAALLPEHTNGPTAHSVAWLAGDDGLEALARLIANRGTQPRLGGPERQAPMGGAGAMHSSASPDTRSSVALPDGGWVALRSTTLEAFLVAGPHSALSGAHAHADALALDVTANGVSVLADPGTYHYMGAERDAFRSTAAHSALTVGSRSSATPGGPFRWARSTDAQLETVSLAGPVSLVRAWHDGYALLALEGSGRVWRELILLHDEQLLLVIDRVEGRFAETVQVHWRPPAGVRAECDASRITLVADEATSGLKHTTPPHHRDAARGATLATIVMSSDWQAKCSMSGYSPGYAVRVNVQGASAMPDPTAAGRGDVALLSVLCPGTVSEHVRVERSNSSEMAWHVRLPSRAYTVRPGALPVLDPLFEPAT